MSISAETAFNNLNIDALTGTQLMSWLNLSPADFGDPQRFSRFKEVIDYFKQFPEDTQRFMITRATTGKLVDKLTHMWEYTKLLERRQGYETLLSSIEKERSILGENPDPIVRSSVDSRSLEARENLAKINSEVAIYEK